MSSLIVEVCEIADVRVHPNADALELATIKGWQAVIRKGQFKNGDLVIYIPIDSMVPQTESDRWGVTGYLSKGRVRCARLRSEPSFGLLIDPRTEAEHFGADESPPFALGDDVAEFYGITKYEPPILISAGDAERPHPLFVAYTDIENLRNFPDVLQAGEEVIVTEKLHGTNSRVGLIEGELMAGSKGLRRKRPEEGATSLYWQPIAIPEVRTCLESLGEFTIDGRFPAKDAQQIVIYGELFGPKIQNLHYGVQQGTTGYRVFDILVNGKYLDWDDVRAIAEAYQLDLVPILYRGPYSIEKIKELAKGNSTFSDHIREGVVVKPVVERLDPKTGRVILKYINDDYLFSKGISDATDV